MESKDRMHVVLLKVQLALLGEVSPPLRAIFVSWTETSIHLDCYFDGEIDDKDTESMACVDTELVAIFPEDHTIAHTLHRLDYPTPLPQRLTCVYARREEW